MKKLITVLSVISVWGIISALPLIGKPASPQVRYYSAKLRVVRRANAAPLPECRPNIDPTDLRLLDGDVAQVIVNPGGSSCGLSCPLSSVKFSGAVKIGGVNTVVSACTNATGISIGKGAKAKGACSIAIGNSGFAVATGTGAISIGCANATGACGQQVSIGNGICNTAKCGIAIGHASRNLVTNGIAIGAGALTCNLGGNCEIAIGKCVAVTTANVAQVGNSCSVFTAGGGIVCHTAAKSANYTLTKHDTLVTVTTGAGTITITTPVSPLTPGQTWRIYKVDTGAGGITTAAGTGVTIVGSVTLNTQGKGVEMRALTSTLIEQTQL